MTKTIKKLTLMQFLMYAPDEIDVEHLLTFIEARTCLKKIKDARLSGQGKLEDCLKQIN